MLGGPDDPAAYSPGHQWGGGEAAATGDLPPGAVYTRRQQQQQQQQQQAAGQAPRPLFKAEPWRISTADRSRCLGIDDKGLDIAAQPGAGWQVSNLFAFIDIIGSSPSACCF